MESAICFKQESCWISDLIQIKLIMGENHDNDDGDDIAMVVMIMMTIVISIFDKKFFVSCPTQIEAISSRVVMFLTHCNWSIIEFNQNIVSPLDVELLTH